jgi:hypothetical protein
MPQIDTYNLTWYEPEWEEPGTTARSTILQGFRLEVSEDKDISPEHPWCYIVRYTYGVGPDKLPGHSETPEVWTVGFVDTREEAMKEAIAAVERAIK